MNKGGLETLISDYGHMNYGKAIRICRTAHGMTQGELAGQTSVGASQLSLIESGRRQPSLRVLHELAVALQIPLPLLTLLASSEDDYKRAMEDTNVGELALSLLVLLISAGRQRVLPLRG